jgi:cytochrome P450
MSDRVEVDFDHLSPGFAASPAEAFRKLRDETPVAWSPHYGGFWVVTGWDDLREIALDDDRFSSDRPDGAEGLAASVIPASPQPIRGCPIEYDPPEALTYRRLMMPRLSPAAVTREIAPLIGPVVEFFVDQFISRGSCDLIDDLASPVPAVVTLAWLGVSLRDWRDIAAAQHGLMTLLPGSAEFEACAVRLNATTQLLMNTISARRAEPRADIISYLLKQTVEGAPLSDEMVLEMVSLMVAGGVDTTTSLIGQALMYLHQSPADRERLIAEPRLRAPATEEFLRVFCPVTSLARTATQDVTLHGQPIRAGDRVMVPWAAANRDPAVFTRPDDVLIDRSPNSHAAFGLGIHRCIGSHMARQTFRLVLDEVLERLPEYTIDESQARPYVAQGIVSGWGHLNASFARRAKRGVPAPYPELADH